MKSRQHFWQFAVWQFVRYVKWVNLQNIYLQVQKKNSRKWMGIPDLTRDFSVTTTDFKITQVINETFPLTLCLFPPFKLIIFFLWLPLFFLFFRSRIILILHLSNCCNFSASSLPTGHIRTSTANRDAYHSEFPAPSPSLVQNKPVIVHRSASHENWFTIYLSVVKANTTTNNICNNLQLTPLT